MLEMYEIIKKQILLGKHKTQAWNNTSKGVTDILDFSLRFKTKQETAPLENIEASYPVELVHMDYLTIESNKSYKGC